MKNEVFKKIITVFISLIETCMMGFLMFVHKLYFVLGLFLVLYGIYIIASWREVQNRIKK